MQRYPASSQGHLGIMHLLYDLIHVASFLGTPFRWQAPPILSFFPFPSFQAPAQHLPTPCTSSSFQELLCIPSYTSPTPSSPCIPFPMNLLDAHKPHLIAPPTPPYPGLCEHHLQACHGGKGPMRQTNKTPVL